MAQIFKIDNIDKIELGTVDINKQHFKPKATITLISLTTQQQINTMGFFVVSCLILTSIQATYSLPKPINNILREKIENLRLQMPCGINGGPSLVPFREELVDVSYDNSTTVR